MQFPGCSFSPGSLCNDKKYIILSDRRNSAKRKTFIKESTFVVKSLSKDRLGKKKEIYNLC